ncbi:MAG: hypothetical protein HKN16_08650 [Saprospiraceae bacterium]|nr:hypothetical protein [Saprospiraceae bacterium]
MAKVNNIWWVLLFVGLFPVALPSQPNLPQLYEQLEKATTPAEKATAYYRLAEVNLFRKPPLAIYQGQQAYKFAEQIPNYRLQSGSAIIMSKAFISQGDFDNADLWVRRALDLAKSVRSGKLVLESTSLLSDLYASNNQFQEAFIQLQEGIEYVNRFPESGPDPQQEKLIRDLKRDISSLQAKEKRLEDELISIKNPESPIPPIETISRETIYIDSTGLMRQDLPQEQIVLTAHDTFLGLPSWWWILGLAILSLGLLASLFWLMGNKDEEDDILAYRVREKDLLIEDYKQEVENLKRGKKMGLHIFPISETGTTKKIETGILVVDLTESAFPSSEKFASQVEKLDKEMGLILGEYPGILMINKVGPRYIFMADPDALDNGLSGLVIFAEELIEYFEDQQKYGWKAKFGVHSGELLFARMDSMPQGVDVWGSDLDRCIWLASLSQPNTLTITSSARDLLENPERWSYLEEQEDNTGKAIRIFKKL